MTNTEQKRAVKKAEIAIDKMVDLQDMGFGNDNIARILEKLNCEVNRIESGVKGLNI